MFLDTINVAASTGLSATAVILMHLNVGLVALVKFAIIKRRARHVVVQHVVRHGVRKFKQPIHSFGTAAWQGSSGLSG